MCRNLHSQFNNQVRDYQFLISYSGSTQYVWLRGSLLLHHFSQLFSPVKFMTEMCLQQAGYKSATLTGSIQLFIILFCVQARILVNL
jgi:hypothetical protein